MKKSLLALAVAFAATNASAVTVYDKDNTSFAVGGRVQSVVYNGAYDKAGDHDAGLVNSARLNLSGNTKINDYVSVFAFSEWTMADGNNAATGDNINTRDQYVGADFGSFGKILAGKAFDALYAVQAATDVFEDAACIDNLTSADRRTGMFRYEFDNNGFFASASYNTASNNALVAGKELEVEQGYAASAGYTFDNVVFGPLAFKGGVTYVEGQDDETDTYFNKFKEFKGSAFSVTWGSLDSGLYLAALYNTHHKTTNNGRADVYGSNEHVKGYELVAGYTFDFGLNVLAGYEVRDSKIKNVNGVTPSQVVRRVPVLVNYQVAPSFNIWTEAEFDANSNSYANEDVGYSKEDRGTKFSVGARYTF
ncbi:MAG: porin [Succinivibrio sp.]|uniref:porin n=1 Tax=Succinivibrio sp. TaxID=2053619 RepID=UPI002F92907B